MSTRLHSSKENGIFYFYDENMAKVTHSVVSSSKFQFLGRLLRVDIITCVKCPYVP